MTPSAEQQLKFLQHLQRLFDEGEFVATYKYALLMALAELSVESGQAEGRVELSLIAIAEKFAEMYWPQTIPYASGVIGIRQRFLHFRAMRLPAYAIHGLEGVTRISTSPLS